MDISFYGGAKIVTGSNYHIKTENYSILIDCGLFQGNRDTEALNEEDFPYDPSKIDFLLLTHAHIDHSGRIPKLVKEGFKGRIICTSPTYDLCKIMLKDSAKIQESDVIWENKKRERAGKPLLEPLYTAEDAEKSLRYFEPYFLGQEIKLNDQIRLRFRDAGHILGSAIIELWVNENGNETKFVFSGDLGMPDRPILNNPEYIDYADYLIMETTYGNRVHQSYEDSTNKLIDIINRTAIRGGTVIIPSFAVGRTQELIYRLNKYYESENIESHMRIPIYIDSPMAVEATEVFKKNSSSFNEEARGLILKGDNPFEFENLRYIKSQEESILLNKFDFPKVIISSSGMANAGRVRHHLKHNIWNENNSLVFVGYQAEGTLGRILLDGVKKVKILGEDIDVKAEIYDIEGFSGHGDRNMLIDWLRNFKETPKNIFLVHGEEESANDFRDRLKEDFGIDAKVPDIMDKFDILKSEFEKLPYGQLSRDKLKDIEDEIDKIEIQFTSILNRRKSFLDKELLDKDYSQVKNNLIELQHNLMDLNMLIGK